MYLFPLLRSLSTLNYFYLQFTMIYFMYKLLVFIVSYNHSLNTSQEMPFYCFNLDGSTWGINTGVLLQM